MSAAKNINIRQVLAGHFSYAQLRRYIVVMSAIFWGLIALCWVVYPTENKWWIASHTFSFLGSFEEKRNPTWWWIFSIAMIFWSFALVPILFYICRRFSLVSRWGARVALFLFLMGCVGVFFVALFPDVSKPVFGDTRWTDIHEIAAVVCFAGFGLAILWLGLLLLKDRFLPGGGRRSFFRHRHVIGPYMLWVSVTSAATYFLVKWDMIYGEMKAHAATTGRQIGSSWSEAMNTIYSFPLWENLLIYTLYIFIVWLALAIPGELGEPREG